MIPWNVAIILDALLEALTLAKVDDARKAALEIELIRVAYETIKNLEKRP